MILVTVTVSVLLDFIQEHRAERAAEALQRAVAVHADVRAGDLVPGDGVLLAVHDLFAKEAMLTGEPFPV